MKKQKIIIINNIKDLFGDDTNILQSVVSNDESKDISVEIKYISEEMQRRMWKYHDIIREKYVEMIIKDLPKLYDENIKTMIDTYIEVLNIDGYDKKLLTDYLFDAINEPGDIKTGLYELLTNKKISNEEMKNYEIKLKENKDEYYELYLDMVKIMLPLMNDISYKERIHQEIKSIY